MPEKREATPEEAGFRGAKSAAIPLVEGAVSEAGGLELLPGEELRLRRFCWRAATFSRSSFTLERMLAASFASRDCRLAAPTVYLESELELLDAAEVSVIAR